MDVVEKIEEPNLASINNDSMYSMRGANLTNLTNDDNFNSSPPKNSILSGSSNMEKQVKRVKAMHKNILLQSSYDSKNITSK